MAIYMKLEGTTIEGPVTLKGFEKQIELRSVDFGANRDITQVTKSDKNRGYDEPSVDYVTVTKDWDGVSSTKLLENLLKGTTNITATISFTSANDSGSLTYLTIVLQSVGFTSYKMRGTGGPSGGVPTENIILSFTNLEITPATVDDKKATNGARMSYNMPTGEVS